MTANIQEALADLNEFIDVVTSGNFYQDYDASIELLGKANDAFKIVEAALATFPPSGERREAIARLIRGYCRSVSPESVQTADGVERIYYAGLSIPGLADDIASGLVQDEAGIRAGDVLPLLNDVLIELRHSQTFITSRQKMHPTGVELYEALIERVAQVIRSARDGGAS